MVQVRPGGMMERAGWDGGKSFEFTVIYCMDKNNHNWYCTCAYNDN
jgi:hypothetical protein